MHQGNQMFLNFPLKPPLSVSVQLSFTLNLCHSVSQQKDTTTTAARGMKNTQTHTYSTGTFTGRCHTRSLAGLDEWA